MNTIGNKYLFFIRRNIEAIIWIIALILLAINNPAEHHYSLCPIDNIGWDFCPGCGLGTSISWFFRGEFIQSFKSHPLGSFAVLILTVRIVVVVRNSIKLYYFYKRQ